MRFPTDISLNLVRVVKRQGTHPRTAPAAGKNSGLLLLVSCSPQSALQYIECVRNV